jgi:MFS family permease
VTAAGRQLFRSLRYRNFRLFFLGQGISLVGTWMQLVAAGWLAYELTAGYPVRTRAIWLGVVAFTGRIPTFVLGPLAGVLVDRWNRRRLIIVTQILAMLQATILAVLTLGSWITLGELIGLSLVLGIINSLDVPARQSFMIHMVDRREDLNNAIALNSSMVNGARVIGPAVAGLLLSVFGAGYCFLLNAVSYVAVVGALFAMEIKAEKRVAPPGRFLRELADGLRYTFRFTPIRDILLLLALVSLTGSSYTVLLPIFAGEVLHRGSGLYALLFAGAGVGALAAAGLLAMRKSAQGLGFWIAGAPVIFGVGLIVLGASPWVWLSLAIMPVIGFGLLAQTASSNTVLQTLVDDGMRGRVMSLYSMAFMGMIPLGSLLAGVLARQWGAPIAVMINGACCIMGALCFHRRLSRRTSYPPILC